jgi:uncharacterized membrane protein
MSDETTTSAATPEVLELDWGDLSHALRAGWRDFLAEPVYGAFFSLVYVACGWLLVFAFTFKGQLWWTLPASAGFPILGPFIACGFYEISRRREAGEPLVLREILLTVLRQKDRQIPSMAAMIVVFFLFWNFLSHMIFALFLGQATLTNVTSSLNVFLTPQGLMMLGFGTSVGAVFSALLFSLTLVSLPMLLEREVDFVTAMLTSIALVRQNPALMLVWGAFIATCLFAGMLPLFFGLMIALPVLGHASWHLYRRAVVWN